MLNPIKVVKSMKYVNQVQSLVKGLTMKNWLTTLHGVVIAGLMISKIWAPANYQDKINDTMMALCATGFFSAADFNTSKKEPK